MEYKVLKKAIFQQIVKKISRYRSLRAIEEKITSRVANEITVFVKVHCLV